MKEGSLEEKANILIFCTTGLRNGGAERVLVNILDHYSIEPKQCVVINLGFNEFYSNRVRELHHVKLFELNARKMLFLLNFFRVFFYLLILKLKNKNLTFIGWMYHGNLISTLFSAMCFSRNNIWSIRATLDALAD